MSEVNEKNYLDNGEGFKSWFFTVDHKRIGVTVSYTHLTLPTIYSV